MLQHVIIHRFLPTALLATPDFLTFLFSSGRLFQAHPVPTFARALAVIGEKILWQLLNVTKLELHCILNS
jgi:hypothetical protein